MPTWALAAAPQYAWEPGLLVLKDEIALPAYGGMQDAAIAAALNAQTVTATGAMQREDAILRMIRANIWGRVLVRAERPFNTSAQAATINGETAAAMQVRDAFLLFADFDLSDATLYSALQRDLTVLVGLGDLTAAQRDAILAVRDRPVRKWDPPVRVEDIVTARGL